MTPKVQTGQPYDPYFVPPPAQKASPATLEAIKRQFPEKAMNEAQAFQAVMQQNSQSNAVRAMAQSTVKTAREAGKFVFGIVTANVNVANAWLEFDGDYGPALNKARNVIFAATVPNRVLSGLTDGQLTEILKIMHPGETVTAAHLAQFRATATDTDRTKGSTLAEVTSSTSNVPRLGEEKDAEPIPEFNLIAAARKLKAEKNLPDTVISKDDIDNFEGMIAELGHNKILNLAESVGAKSKDGIQALLKLELSLMELDLDVNMPAIHLTGTPLKEGQGSYGPKQQFLEFVLGADVTTAMDVPKNKDRFSPKTILAALENEINMGVWTNKNGEKVNPKTLNFLATPGCIRLLFWTLHASKTHDACKVITPQQINASAAAYKTMVGTDEEVAEQFAQRMFTQGAGIIALQECKTAVVEALKKRGFFNTKERLPEADRYGTTLMTHRDVIIEDGVVRTAHEYRDDKGRSGKLETLWLPGTEKMGNHSLFVANLHADAAKAGEGVKPDWMLKLNESYVQWQKLQKLNGKHIDFVALGDLNIKSDQERIALDQWATDKGFLVTRCHSTTWKFRIFSFQRFKSGKYLGGDGDVVITNIVNFKALETLLGGTREQSSEALPKKGHPFDHWDVQLTVAAEGALESKTPEPEEQAVHVHTGTKAVVADDLD